MPNLCHGASLQRLSSLRSLAPSRGGCSVSEESCGEHPGSMCALTGLGNGFLYRQLLLRKIARVEGSVPSSDCLLAGRLLPGLRWGYKMSEGASLPSRGSQFRRWPRWEMTKQTPTESCDKRYEVWKVLRGQRKST